MIEHLTTRTDVSCGYAYITVPANKPPNVNLAMNNEGEGQIAAAVAAVGIRGELRTTVATRCKDIVVPLTCYR